MRLGLFTMPLHPPGSDLAVTLDQDLEQIITLDRLGFDEVWIGEHFTAEWENIPTPELLIARALSETKNIKLGTGVTCMPNHDPFSVAHRIAVLDNLAKGRFQWGVGSGGFPGDFDVRGYDVRGSDHRVMTPHAIDAVLDLWDDPEPGLRKSPWWEYTVPEPNPLIGVRVHIKPYQKPHPPIAVAGVSEKSDTLALAGERGWIPLSINIVPTRVLMTHWEAVEEGAAKTGKTPDRSEWRIAREIFVADTTEEARERALTGVMSRDWTGYWAALLPFAHMVGLTKTDLEIPDSAIDWEYMVDNIALVGSPDDVAAKIRALHQDVGGFGVVLAMGHEWVPEDHWRHSMELLAHEVMPRVADLN